MTPSVFSSKATSSVQPLDLHASRLEMLDQDALVNVLRQREGEGVAAEALAEGAEVGSLRRRLPACVRLMRLDPQTGRQYVVDDAELPVKLQRARLHRKRPRRLARAGIHVDDADVDAEPRQPERQSEAGRPGADDENLRTHSRHRVLPSPDAGG